MGVRRVLSQLIGRPDRRTPADTADVERALERARASLLEALEAVDVGTGRWVRVERIIERSRVIREENHLADAIRVALGGPSRG